jgi:hypothetical protein
MACRLPFQKATAKTSLIALHLILSGHSHPCFPLSINPLLVGPLAPQCAVARGETPPFVIMTMAAATNTRCRGSQTCR